jgi:ABC-2 type transport system ATP-binding protein
MRAPVPSTSVAGEWEVRTRDLGRRYGRTEAVSAMNLEVPAGSFYLLVGQNGAGKTTTFRMLLGTLKPTSGSVEVCGVQPGCGRRCPGPDRRSPGDPGPALQVVAYPGPDQTSRGLLPLLGRRVCRAPVASAGDPAGREVWRAVERPGPRVQLLVALAHRPPLLLLDEPTDGLDPVARDRVQGVLAEHIADTPTTVLVATHLVYEMERFADHVGVLQGGRLLLQVSRHELHARLRRYVFEVPDGSVIIAVIANEPQKPALIELTSGAALLAPTPVHWEVGNAFSAMLKRQRITLKQAKTALQVFHTIPIRWLDVDLTEALEAAAQLDVYAYDAYVIAAARKQKCSLLALDGGLVHAAKVAGVPVLEVDS